MSISNIILNTSLASTPYIAAAFQQLKHDQQCACYQSELLPMRLGQWDSMASSTDTGCTRF